MVSILSFKDIAKIFEEIELRLISSLKRNLKRHKAEVKTSEKLSDVFAQIGGEGLGE